MPVLKKDGSIRLCGDYKITVNKATDCSEYAPSMFQRIMESILQEIPRVIIYIDDILVSGRNGQEHYLQTLDAVMSRLEEAVLKLKCSKCLFLLPSIEFLGHKICKDGVYMSACLQISGL